MLRRTRLTVEAAFEAITNFKIRLLLFELRKLFQVRTYAQFIEALIRQDSDSENSCLAAAMLSASGHRCCHQVEFDYDNGL